MIRAVRSPKGTPLSPPPRGQVPTCRLGGLRTPSKLRGTLGSDSCPSSQAEFGRSDQAGGGAGAPSLQHSFLRRASNPSGLGFRDSEMSQEAAGFL